MELETGRLGRPGRAQLGTPGPSEQKSERGRQVFLPPQPLLFFKLSRLPREQSGRPAPPAPGPHTPR